VALEHGGVDRRFHLRHALDVVHRHHRVSGLALAEDADAGRGKRQQQHVVFILLARQRALRAHHADHLERHVADQDALPHGIGHVGHQLFRQVRAQHGHGGHLALVFLRKEAALGHGPGLDLRQGRPRAAHIGLHVEVAVAYHLVARDIRQHVGNARHVLERIEIGQGDAAPGDARTFAARRHVQQVRAERAQLRHHLLARAQADGQHDDHGSDADDDAQQGQSRAEAVDPQHAPGRARRVEQFRAQRRPCIVGGARHVQRRQGRRRGGNGNGARVRHDFAIADLDHAARLGRHLAVMRNEDDGVARVGQLAQQGHDFGAAAAV